MEIDNQPHPSNVIAGSVRTTRQWQAYAELALSKGASKDAALSDMLNAGCPDGVAREVIEYALDIQRRSANRLLGCSVAFMLAGILVTAFTYAAATSSAGGGTYFIWWGPVVCGALGAIVGLCRRLRLP